MQIVTFGGINMKQISRFIEVRKQVILVVYRKSREIPKQKEAA